ncbi:DNA-3-methyladenine glycosylase [Ereboglobus sp. PH5-10]|nr:DNA-3-methyladenine glycosylase [Ereboglobus sp. PH5-10]
MGKSIKAKPNRAGNVMSPEVLRCKNTVALARRLIGKTLARRLPGGETQRAIITETEAYHGETDLACHASKGRTARTDVMYRAGGVWYVYLCYGVHEMLNLVTGPEDFPSAILIRAAGGVTGPGRLTKALKINRALNGACACDPASGLWIEDTPAPVRASQKQILITPRIGIDYAGPVWSAKPWRFVLKGNQPEK